MSRRCRGRARGTEVQIRDFEFVPAAVVIMKGENVKWTNLGQVTHTSTSDTGKWDSGDPAHGRSFEFRFTTTGSFAYHCAYHPAMKGTVRVTETAVEPASLGRVKALFR
ncbi:MAG TPA: plastocyanin/azurin family copper-binding protein [bacterium]|nr:plastocyanin/azurin family copper-binding protein [bacterium]